MSIAVSKSFTITDDETGEEIKIGVNGNGNVYIDIKGDEIRPDTFEEFIRVAKVLLD